MKKNTLVDEMIDTINKFANKKMRTAISKISQGDMAVLMCLYKTNKNNQAIMPSQISEHLKINRSAVTIALNSLEEKNYVVRKRINPNGDRRKVNVEITDEGITLIEQRMTESQNVSKYITDNLGEEQSRQLILLANKAFLLVEQYKKNKTTSQN